MIKKFAKLDSNNIVVNIESATQEWVDEFHLNNSDFKYVEYTDDEPAYMFGDYINKKFYQPQPYPSWVRNSETLEWEAPVVKPDDGLYIWDEDNQEWKEVEL